MIKKIIKAQPAIEGAGVKLNRIFGFNEKGLFDPFLLLDNFGSSNPDEYMSGFPWHPHRGMETVTYMMEGSVEHGDSLGNKAVIDSGDVQWMTAGSGIVHQEMPIRYNGIMRGFQLWVNLPRKLKMTQPKYRDILASNIPEIAVNENTTVKIISGEIDNKKGAVDDLGIDIFYFDVTISNSGSYNFAINPKHNVFAYIYEGSGYFEDSEATKDLITTEHVVLFQKDNKLKIRARDTMKFLLIGGKPLNEPVAWEGPIVMNTRKELHQAFEEYRNGTFVK